MLISKAKLTAVIFSLLAFASFYVIVFEISISANKAFATALPYGLRTAYLNRIFSTTSADCRGCKLRLIAALELLEDDVSSGRAAKYDYARLLPFIRSDSHNGYDEPVFEMACNDVLGAADRAVMDKMVAMYHAEPQIIKECAAQRLDVVKQLWPHRYRKIDATVRQVPTIAAMLDQE